MDEILKYLTIVLDFIFRYFWFIVLAFVVLRFFRRKSAHKKMQEIALKLGLEFQGKSQLKQIEAQTASMIQQRSTESPQVLNFISKAIDFVKPFVLQWELMGKWNDVPVRVFSEADKNKGGRYTVVRAAVENGRSIGLHIVAEKFLSKTFFGNKDITSGNEELDKMILVQATDPNQAKMLLMSPYLQDALLQAFKFSKAMSIEDQYVSVYHPGNLGNEEKLRAALDHVTRTALALRSAGR